MKPAGEAGLAPSSAAGPGPDAQGASAQHPDARGTSAQHTDAQGPDVAQPRRDQGFAVKLENFSGPFDVLLGLIGKHQLDITEISLARVTDEFIAYIRELRQRVGDKALDETTAFLVVASTLLDLKAARLLPTGEVESDEDVALLEARDLLFARLLQYKAFKVMAAHLAERLAGEAERFPRQVALEPQFAALLPELLWKTSVADFAALAHTAFEPRPAEPTEVSLGHLHAPAVSVREQAALLAGRLAGGARLGFGELVADAANTAVVVARFLALLEMFRDQVVGFEQDSPLGELVVHWNREAGQWDPSRLREEYDDAAAAAGNAGQGGNTGQAGHDGQAGRDAQAGHDAGPGEGTETEDRP